MNENLCKARDERDEVSIYCRDQSRGCAAYPDAPDSVVPDFDIDIYM